MHIHAVKVLGTKDAYLACAKHSAGHRDIPTMQAWSVTSDSHSLIGEKDM